MKLKIEICGDNAAFEDVNRGEEMARILKEAANKCAGGYLNSPGDEVRLMDYNGNTVGKAKVVK